MAEEKKELTEEELEQASGGKRISRASDPSQGGRVVANDGTQDADTSGDDGGATPSIGGSDPLPDPPFHP